MTISKPYKSMLFVCTALSLVLIASSCTSSASQVNAGPGGIAIKGYDPVAYFTEGKPVKGSEKFIYQWNGAAWQFASSENLNLFSAAPDKYAPQYGGY